MKSSMKIYMYPHTHTHTQCKIPLELQINAHFCKIHRTLINRSFLFTIMFNFAQDLLESHYFNSMTNNTMKNDYQKVHVTVVVSVHHNATSLRLFPHHTKS